MVRSVRLSLVATEHKLRPTQPSHTTGLLDSPRSQDRTYDGGEATQSSFNLRAGDKLLPQSWLYRGGFFHAVCPEVCDQS